MTDNETGIDNTKFLTRVAQKKQEESASGRESLVGYSSRSAAPSGGTVRRTPPRIPPLQIPGLFKRSEEPQSDLEAMVRADADEMFADLDIREKSPLDQVVDDALAQLDVLTAYRKWVGKMDPKVYDGQTESIKISCPIPGHEDNDPSAWINTVKGDGGLWHCGGCQRGGDKYDLAAVGLGYNMFQYKTDGTFRQLKLDMAREIGVDVDSHLMGPATRAYLAQKEQHEKVEQAPAVVEPQETRQKPAETESSIPRPSAPVDPLVAMHMGAAEEYARVTRKYYNPPKEEAEATPSPSLPIQLPGVSPRPAAPSMPQTKAAPVVPPPVDGAPPGVTSKEAPPPQIAGLGAVFGAAVAPPPAALVEPQEQKPAGPPPGFTPLKAAPPKLGLGLLPVPGGGQLFVREAKPTIDPSDPGLMKAVLEDHGVKTEVAESNGDQAFTPLDFRTLVPENTFLYQYCSILLKSPSPDEWNLWNGIVGISSAVGKRIGMADIKPVYSNVYVCLMGETTAGKSIAKSYILSLIRKTLPFLNGDPTSTGPRYVSGAASGEILLSKLRNEIRDPAKLSSVLEVLRVAGLAEYDELATVMAKSSGPSSNFVPILQGLFDGYLDVESSSFTTGDKVAPDPFMSMLTSTQPSMMQKLVGREHVDNGFLNRFIFAPAIEKEVPEEQLLGGEAISVEPSAPYLRAIHEWAVENEGRNVQWDPAALQLGRSWLKDVVVANKKKYGENKLIQRTDLLVKKLMLLFTLNMRSSVVTTEAVEAAMKVYPYLMDSYKILDRELTTTESSELREKILLQAGRLTAKNGKPPTKRELHDALGRSRVDDHILIRAIKNLVELGDLKELQWPLPEMPQVGRKSVRYGLATDD